MSLQYIIDGYNLIHNPAFTYSKKINPVRNTKYLRGRNEISNGVRDTKRALLELIKTKRLCGSPRNKIIVVFDGYPGAGEFKQDYADAEVIFSGKETADDKVKKIIEASGNCKNIVVVTDDKEFRFFVKAAGCRIMGVEEFINRKDRLHIQEEGFLKTELNYSQIDKINQELKKIWLK